MDDKYNKTHSEFESAITELQQYVQKHEDANAELLERVNEIEGVIPQLASGQTKQVGWIKPANVDSADVEEALQSLQA